MSASDPRRLGGDMAGPGGPYEDDGVIVDNTNAVLVDHQTVALVAVGHHDQDDDWNEKALALLLEGRVNKTDERVRVLFLVNADGAAALVTEVVGICKREGAEFAAEFLAAFEARMKAMP